MRRLLFLVVAVLSLVLSLSAATATSADPAWTITDLGIESDWSHATVINDHGVVVGRSARGGFLWRNGVTTDLGVSAYPQDNFAVTQDGDLRFFERLTNGTWADHLEQQAARERRRNAPRTRPKSMDGKAQPPPAYVFPASLGRSE